MQISRTLSVAPMLDVTDRHCRYFLRLISKHTLLYTEMITTGALLHGDRERFLRFDNNEHPLALQLGGSDPDQLALCASMVENAGYDEVNLNIGCPSNRVQSGRFGACLMANPELVAECINAMTHVVSIPVTIKTRIGIDDLDSYEHLFNFVHLCAQAGCKVFIIHARKAWLKGLSPKQNRDVPPLQYHVVYKLKQDFPDLEIILNGGITDLKQAQEQLQHVDGVMIGRAAYDNPYMLTDADYLFYQDDHEKLSRCEIIQTLLPYVRTQLAEAVLLRCISRHVLGLFHAKPGARQWRRYVTEHAGEQDANVLIHNMPDA